MKAVARTDEAHEAKRVAEAKRKSSEAVEVGRKESAEEVEAKRQSVERVKEDACR